MGELVGWGSSTRGADVRITNSPNSQYNEHLMPTGGRDRPAGKRLVSALALALLTYALVLAAGPLLHHDLACHLKSRTHCTSCVAGLSAPGLTSDSQAFAADLTSAIEVHAGAAVGLAMTVVWNIQGRAPPA